jgi:F-type H+-transporting ATPase subunit c
MIGVAIAFVGLALGVPIAVLGGATGQGRAAAAALEGIARQPEAAGEIRILLIIALALIESLVIYALLTFFLLMGNIGKMLEKVQGG